MTQETVRALSDSELVQAIAWGQEEQKARTDKRKQEAIAKIKALAVTVGISVSINNKRGDPQQKANMEPATGRATK